MAAATERLAVIVDGKATGGISALKQTGDAASKADHSVAGLLLSMDKLGGHTSKLGLGAAAAGFGALTVATGAAGFAAERFARSTLDIGIDYQTNLNSMQAVTQATAAQMQQAAKVARGLGNDMSLPATSAADAAAAMVELAKGNLTADQAMQAAKGTLTLAAAAQVDGATAATIQADAINAFNLKASEAGHVADVLANAANAATGEIGDFAFGLQASAAVSHQFGVSLDDNVTALALFANSGIKGSDAGTSLKSMLLALASPSDNAAEALKELGVDAFDAKGHFVGLRQISLELAAAQKRMSQEAFTAATSTAFGSDAARAAGVFAHFGADGFDQMAKSVGRAGGASDVAKSKMQGVGGAIQGLQSQVETVKIDIFNRNAPDIEALINAFSKRIPGAANAVLGAMDSLATRAHAAFPVIKAGVEVLGPAIQSILADKLQTAADAVQRVLFPALRGIGAVAKGALPGLLELSHVLNEGLRAGFDAAASVVVTFERNADGLGDTISTFGHAASEAGHAALPILETALNLAATAVSALVDGAALLGDVLGPIAGPAAKTAAAITLIVVAAKGLRAGIGGIGSFTKTAADALEKFATKAKDVANVSENLSYAPKHAAPAFSGLTSRLQALAGALPIVGIGFGVIGTELEHNAQQTAQATDHYKTLFEQVQLGGATAEAASAQISALKKLLATDFGHGIFGKQVADEFNAGKQAADAYQRSLSQSDIAQQAVTRTQNDLTLAIKSFGANSPQATTAAQRYNTALNDQKQLEDNVAAATQTATDKLLAKANALLGAANSDVGYRQSQLDTKSTIDDVATAQQALTDAVAQYGAKSPQAKAATDALTQARLSEEQAALRQVQAASQLAVDALPATASAEDKARAATNAQIKEYQRLAGTLAPGDPLRNRLFQYSRELRDVPTSRRTDIHLSLPDAKRAEEELNRIARDRQTQVRVDVLTFSDIVSGVFGGKHATGGAVAAGVPVIVGDGGRPEVFIPNTSGSIRPQVAGGTGADDMYALAQAVAGAMAAAMQGAQIQFDRDGIARIVLDNILANKGRR